MEQERKYLKYTQILHEPRIELGLSVLEYCVADSIYHLSNNPAAAVRGWCYASKKEIGEKIGISEQSVFNILKRLFEKKLVEKHEITKHLRTTEKWYQAAVESTKKTEAKETLARLKKIEPEAKETLARVAKESLVNNNIYNNNINNNNLKIIAGSDEPDGKSVNEIIDLFRGVNPAYNALFANKTQRAAVRRLVTALGRPKLEAVITALERTNQLPYAPVITTPLQLEAKVGSLIAFVQKQAGQNGVLVL